MPTKARPLCSACKTNKSPMWRKDESGIVMCNSCYLNHLSVSASKDENETGSVTSDNDSLQSGSHIGLRTAIVAAKQTDALSNMSSSKSYTSNSQVRKSMRIKQPKSKAQSKANVFKGKNRRSMFKRNVSKSNFSVTFFIS